MADENNKDTELEDIRIDNQDRDKSVSGDDGDANKPLKQNDNNNSQAIGKVDKETIDTNIKQAYKSRDAEKSRQFHEKKLAMKKTKSDGSIDENDLVLPLQEESHKSHGDYVKSIIYGGLDGIITTFAVVAGVAGADLDVAVILVLGFANLVADGISMGVGDYISAVAEDDFARSERQREMWEFENHKEGEIQEMIEIYKEKGVSEKDAQTILNIMAKYPDFFVNHMLVQELDIKPVEEDGNPMCNGLVTMGSFMMFGCVPLLSYLIFSDIDTAHEQTKFYISIALTVATLGVLGLVKGKLTESNLLKSSLFVILNGVLAAGASYLIGLFLSEITGIHGEK